MKWALFAAVTFLIFPLISLAQSGLAPCPPGMVPGPGHCYGANELTRQKSRSTYSGPLWQDRYGALADSATSNAGGVAQNMSSEREARKKALSDCSSNDCKIRIVERNGCLAAAWGGGINGYGTGQDLPAAETDAKTRCEKGGGNGCKIEYSACSLPLRVQ